MREASGNKDLTVEVKPLVNDSVPVMLVEDEQTRRFNDMGRIYGHSEFTMPAKYSVVLNSRSRTIEKLAAREKDPPALRSGRAEPPAAGSRTDDRVHPPLDGDRRYRRADVRPPASAKSILFSPIFTH